MVMDGVLNTSTNTVHKHEHRNPSSKTTCGATRFVSNDQLHRMDVEDALTGHHANKCGRCFSDGGGY